MIAELIGAAIGKDIDESDGEGGLMGAVLGAASAVVIKRLVPLAIIGAGILVARHYLKGVDQPG